VQFGARLLPGRLGRLLLAVQLGCGKFSWRQGGSLVKIGKVPFVSTTEDLVMDRMAQMLRDAFVAAMRRKCEEILGQVADAINQAPTGSVIAGSEEKVRDLFGDLRQQAFEMGLQMRIDAAEAAFSPSERSEDGQETAE
jgi:hypothetical protein